MCNSHDLLIRKLRKLTFNETRIEFNRIQNEVGFPNICSTVEFLELRDKVVQKLLLERTGWTYGEYTIECMKNLERELSDILASTKI